MAADLEASGSPGRHPYQREPLEALLRHTIAFQGVPVSEVAAILGNGARIVEKHYSQVDLGQTNRVRSRRYGDVGLVVPLELALYMAVKPKHEYNGGCYVEGEPLYIVAEVRNFMHVTPFGRAEKRLARSISFSPRTPRLKADLRR